MNRKQYYAYQSYRRAIGKLHKSCRGERNVSNPLWKHFQHACQQMRKAYEETT
jgi:hypothetical protein